jgi:hypothetical protein
VGGQQWLKTARLIVLIGEINTREGVVDVVNGIIIKMGSRADVMIVL